MSLEPLSDEQSERLIENLLGSTEMPAEVAERIVDTAEGNPLFVEEMLAMLIDDGSSSARTNGGSRRRPVRGDRAGLDPGLLASRLDRLTPEERTVLEAAAVVGKEFFLGAVRDLVDEDAATRVPGDLMALVRKELIRPEPHLPGRTRSGSGTC